MNLASDSKALARDSCLPTQNTKPADDVAEYLLKTLGSLGGCQLYIFDEQTFLFKRALQIRRPYASVSIILKHGSLSSTHQ